MSRPETADGRPLEIERKFLIEYPDTNWLESRDGVQTVQITQYYFDTPEEKKLRVRSWTEKGKTMYILTRKTRITDLVRIEEEQEITREEFEAYLSGPFENRRQISKTRYRFPSGGRTVEVDLYPFWNDRAIAEVELESEDETVSLPEELAVIREVTEDRAYTNYNLAGCSADRNGRPC